MSEQKNNKIINLIEKQLVIFRLSGEEFGVDVSQIKEIIRVQDITPMPKAPDFIEGIINLRGQIVAIINLAKRFCLKAVNLTPKSRIIISDINKNIIGLIVDEVPEVLRITEKDIYPTPEIIETQIHSDFIKGVCKFEKRLIVLLDLDKILSQEEIKQVTKNNDNKI